ncbi:hypothetical protein L9F63_028357, partial [Diploptera punctata]
IVMFIMVKTYLFYCSQVLKELKLRRRTYKCVVCIQNFFPYMILKHLIAFFCSWKSVYGCKNK